MAEGWAMPTTHDPSATDYQTFELGVIAAAIASHVFRTLSEAAAYGSQGHFDYRTDGSANV